MKLCSHIQLLILFLQIHQTLAKNEIEKPHLSLMEKYNTSVSLVDIHELKKESSFIAHGHVQDSDNKLPNLIPNLDQCIYQTNTNTLIMIEDESTTALHQCPNVEILTMTCSHELEKKKLSEYMQNLKREIKSIRDEFLDQRIIFNGEVRETKFATANIKHFESTIRSEITDSIKTSLNNEIDQLISLLKAEVEKAEGYAKRITELEIEKAGVLTADLVAEQNCLKILENDKLELVEKNNSLSKDLNRLRQHLVDIETTHIQETMELQKIIEEKKAEIVLMEELVKKSNTAYTSAKYVLTIKPSSEGKSYAPFEFV